MIFTVYQSKRPATVLHSVLPPPMVPKQTQTTWSFPGSTPTEPRPNTADRDRAKQFNIDPDEFVRRDKIVRQMWVDCQINAGDLVRAVGEEGWKKYGKLTVRGVYKNYHEFSIAEARDWPKDDKPFIITVEPEKKPADSKLLLVIPTWLKRL